VSDRCFSSNRRAEEYYIGEQREYYIGQLREYYNIGELREYEIPEN